MKKNMRKLVVATCLLLVSAVLMGTSTYAWFAMNTNSKADGLEVEAYSDSLYLEISQSVDSGYAANTSFTTNNTGTLRLVTHKFFDYNEIVTITATEITDGSKYNGTGTYYKAADSDRSQSDLNYVVANGDLQAPDSTAGLYKNIVFEMVTSSGLVSGTYYELSQNKFVQKTLTNQSAKGLYTACNYVAATGTYNGNSTYYQKTSTGYAVVDTTVGFESTTDMSSYYLRVDSAPDAEATGAEYDGVSTYYSFDQTNKTFALVGTLELGSELNGYYTIAATAVDTATTEGDGTTVYYLKNEVDTDVYEYSYIGTIPDGQILANYLYWGRAYSNDPTAVQASNTLNIIADNDASDYYLAQTLYLRQAEGTNHASNLRIADVKVGGAYNELSNAIRVLFVASSTSDPDAIVTATYDCGLDKFVYANENKDEALLFDMLLGNEAETVKVDLYIYFDGTDDVAKNTDAILNGQTIDIEFAIDELSYN